MRSFLKTTVLCVAYVCDRLLRFFKVRAPFEVSILMYHAIHDSPGKLNVTPDAFLRQMRYVAQYYTVVPLADIVAYAQGTKQCAGRTIALTFDDGYADTYSVVFPLLRELGVPFTVFLTTSLEQSKTFNNLPRISWNEVKDMYASGLVTFGVHGHTHANLKTLVHDRGAMDAEVIECQKLIQQHTGGEKPTLVAYASGHKNDAVVSYMRESGFVGGCTINEGLIQVGDDPLLLRRTQIDSTMNFVQFMLRLTGAIDIHRMIMSYLRYGYGFTR